MEPEEQEIDVRKEKITGALGVIGMAAFTIIGLIIKNLFFK